MSTGVMGLEYNGSVYYYKKNIQNDVVGILNSNYEEVVKYKYDSYGKLLRVEDSNGNEIEDVNNIGIINPFRWNQDIEHSPHYHILAITFTWSGSKRLAPHYRPGMIIPKPWASVYF